MLQRYVETTATCTRCHDLLTVIGVATGTRWNFASRGYALTRDHRGYYLMHRPDVCGGRLMLLGSQRFLIPPSMLAETPKTPLPVNDTGIASKTTSYDQQLARKYADLTRLSSTMGDVVEQINEMEANALTNKARNGGRDLSQSA